MYFKGKLRVLKFGVLYFSGTTPPSFVVPTIPQQNHNGEESGFLSFYQSYDVTNCKTVQNYDVVNCKTVQNYDVGNCKTVQNYVIYHKK